MEIILGIAILVVLAYMFTRKKDVAEATQEVPYKVEEAAVVTDATETVATPVVAADEAPVEIVPDAVVTAKKPRAKKAAAEKKPRAKKAPKA